MDKNFTAIRMCFHPDRSIEREALSHLQKCKRSQATLVSCAIREFVEKYQLHDLTEEELKKFLKTYMDFISGVNKAGADASRLQKSLRLIGSEGKREPADKSADACQTSPSPTGSFDSPSASAPEEKESSYSPSPVHKDEPLVSEASREKMNSVLGMFRQQK